MNASTGPVISMPSIVDSADFRKQIALLATGISVVTVEDDELDVHGMTINSFASISLAPPTVLISLKPGKMHRLISRRGWYGVSILECGQQTYAQHFSGRSQRGFDPDLRIRDRIPTLKDALAWFECEVSQTIEVCDHTLFVASVTACGSSRGQPLLFFRSAYHKPSLDTE